MRLVLVLVVAGCTSEAGKQNPPHDPPFVGEELPSECRRPGAEPSDPPLEWANTGQPFLVTWCESCHAAGKVGIDRLGAPETVTLGTLADARLRADRIVARVLVEPATMPPATQLQPHDLERFTAWMACDLPGEELPVVPPDGCAELRPAPGDLRSSAADPAFCASWNAVEGNFVIDAVSPALDCLCDVGGAITVEPAFDGETLVLPALVAAGAIDVTTNPGLRAVTLPALVEVDGDVVLAELPVLGSAEMPWLERVGGAFVVWSVPGVGSVGVHRLAEVGGSLRLIDVPSLDGLLPFDSLLVVGGDFELLGTGVVEPQDFRRLGSVGGDLLLTENPLLASFEGFDLLASVGGSLEITGHPELRTWSAMPSLEQVGGNVTFQGNPGLRRSDVESWVAEIDLIGGAVVLNERRR